MEANASANADANAAADAAVPQDAPCPPQERVVIVGAGVVGLCSAFHIATMFPDKRVTLIERSPDVALHTSFANAGRFCPTPLVKSAMASPASLAMTLKLLVGMDKGDNPTLPSHVRLTPSLLHWGTWFMRSCVPSTAAANTAAQRSLVRQCLRHTHDMLQALAQTEEGKGWGWSGKPTIGERICKRDSTLQLFANDEEWERAGSHNVQCAFDNGLHGAKLVDADEAGARFPWLRQWKKTAREDNATGPRTGSGVGCVWARNDFSVDVHKFSCEVLQFLNNHTSNVNVLFNTSVEGVVMGQHANQRVAGVVVSGGELVPCDKLVLCCGLSTAKFVKEHFGTHIPLEGMKGYTLELTGCTNAPELALMDYGSGKLGFQVTPFGHGRVRLIGFAEFDDDAECDPRYRDALVDFARRALPDMTWTAEGALWCGHRPMSPDGLPIVGAVPGTDNVFVNCGHGAYGWTSAPATGHILATVMTNADHDGAYHSLALERFGWKRFFFGVW